MTTTEILSRLKGVTKSGSGWMAQCPVHHDKHASLCVSNGGDKTLLHDQAGCSTESIVSTMGLKMSDLFNEPKTNGQRHIVATYDYRDEDGALLYQCVRYEPKDFRQRRPDGNGGWIWNIKGVRRVLYRLPELLASDPDETVWIVEGEKDVESLRALGLIATCNVFGASKANHNGGGKWRSEYNEYFRGRRVVIIPDNDESGQKHACNIATHLQGIAV